jgi:nitrogenase molybdenum-iron protein alpha/beta subunit
VLRSGPDLREVRRLLSLAGISVISALPAGASLETMRKMGAAALNVVICETSGLEAARYLEERFGTPYLVTDFPIGPDESRAWLQGVARAMSIKFAVPADSFPALPPVRVRERRIAIFSGPTRAVAVARFLSGLGVSPRLIVLDFPPPDPAKVAAAAGPSCEVLVSPDWDEIVERVQELGIDLLIGGMMESPLAARFGIPLLDIMHGSQRSAGAQGAGLLLSFLQEGPGKKS